MRNRRLIKQYPWIMPRLWTGKKLDDYDYTWTLWELPTGWHKAFGQMYLEELGAAVKEAGFNRTFSIEDLKEKYGSLRIYVGCEHNNRILQIIDKYEHLSSNICIGCGKPDVPIITVGWISPMCFDCYEKSWRKREKYLSKFGGGDTPSSLEIIKKTYEEDTKGSSNTISDSYTIHGYSKDTVYDISATVNAIRQRWNKRKRKLRDGYVH